MMKRAFFRAVTVMLTAILCVGCRMDKTGSQKNNVTVAGSKGQWTLLVNGETFHLKGAGVARMEGRYQKADYLKLAKEMGANTVRTWGAEQGTRAYLDQAHAYGLFVAAGIWLNPVHSPEERSYQDDQYKKEVAREVLTYVFENKDHPAILFWNIGNEVFYWTKSEQERIAFAKFLEELIQQVQRIDPDHPVVYTSAFTTAVPYIKEHVPSLDLLGVNAYGGFDQIQSVVSEQLDIPYVVTEFGTLGNWDRPKDLNGIALESTDDLKAHYYRVYAHQIRNFSGHCLGGFAFQLGDTTQTSASWWNMTQGQYPKAAYVVMKAFYHGEEKEYQAPVIKDIVFSKRKELSPGEGFDLEVQLRPFNGPVRYEYFATTARDIDFWEEYPNHFVEIRVEGEGQKVRAYAPQEPGLYRIYAVTIDENNAASVFNKSISVLAL